jgi:hypothetical protein
MGEKQDQNNSKTRAEAAPSARSGKTVHDVIRCELNAASGPCHCILTQSPACTEFLLTG